MVSGGRSLAFALRLRSIAGTAAARTINNTTTTRTTARSSLRRPLVAGPSRRLLSTETAAAPPAPAPSRGSSLFQRLSSFLAGVGVTSLVGYYFLYQDVKRSTELVKASLGDITKRLEAVEKR